MMLAPYFLNGDMSKLLSNAVHLPHVRLIQSVLQEQEYYADIETNMIQITSKPVYFLFADPLAFSALRCDANPRTCIDLNTTDAIKYQAKQLKGKQATCSTSFIWSDHIPKPFQSKCFDSQGKEYWHALESFLQVWSKDKILGIYKDFPGHEYLSAKAPDQFLMAIESLHNFTLTNHGYQNWCGYSSYYILLVLILRMIIISSK